MSINNETNNSQNKPNKPGDIPCQSEFNGGFKITPKKNDGDNEEKNSGI